MSYYYDIVKFNDIWSNNPLIIFDTNGILNIYKYSTDTINQILKVLDKVPTHQYLLLAEVLNEYNKNRKNVISREYNKYKEVTRELERIIQIAKNDINKQFYKYNKFRFPQVKELGKRINESIEYIEKEAQSYSKLIKEEAKLNQDLLKEDRVHLFVDNLIKANRIGKKFSLSELLGIYNEGELRYKYRIPPGYMDADKDKSDTTKREKFGDLVIWKELLSQAKECNKPIIFITNDEKEDWWTLDDYKYPISPRMELLSEFQENSNEDLIFISLTNFINFVSEINKMVNLKTYIEMNATGVCEDLIFDVGLEEVLNEEGQLSNYLIHCGDLQDYCDNDITDVEINDYYETIVEIETVEFHGNHVVIEGILETEVDIMVTEYYSPNYSEETNCTLSISGYISFEFDVNFNKGEDFIIYDSLKIEAGGLSVQNFESLEENDKEDRCQDCGRPQVSYQTRNEEPICEECSWSYEVCTECGKLVEQDEISGSFCEDCLQLEFVD
ncbi:PIN-like domain-containing protein [Bacillales bacterium AN1005]